MLHYQNMDENMAKRRKKAETHAAVAAEPVALAEVLDQVPAIQQAHAANEHQEPEPQAGKHAEEHKPKAEGGFATRVHHHRMQPPPEGFRSMVIYPLAGLRATRSYDGRTSAIQFDNAHPAIRGGMNSEVELLAVEGFTYSPHRRQWERYDGERPSANAIDTERLAEELAGKRMGQAQTPG